MWKLFVRGVGRLFAPEEIPGLFNEAWPVWRVVFFA
jgi:hypothetical protein